MAKKPVTGINIQFPISRLILEGTKIVETRTYPIPTKYLGQKMAIIETPGGKGDFTARVVGLIEFESCFRYKSRKAFYDDSHLHFVTPGSPWSWKADKPKWGWKIKFVKRLENPIPLRRQKGIVYTKNILLEI